MKSYVKRARFRFLTTILRKKYFYKGAVLCTVFITFVSKLIEGVSFTTLRSSFCQKSFYLILLLMINAAVLGTTAVSLSSAWAYGEVKGWPHSLQLPVRKAPGFYAVYILCTAAAAAIVLIPHAPLQLIIVSVQILAGILLPSAIVFLQLLLNDKELLGERFANKRWNN